MNPNEQQEECERIASVCANPTKSLYQYDVCGQILGKSTAKILEIIFKIDFFKIYVKNIYKEVFEFIF